MAVAPLLPEPRGEMGEIALMGFGPRIPCRTGTLWVSVEFLKNWNIAFLSVEPQLAQI